VPQGDGVCTGGQDTGKTGQGDSTDIVGAAYMPLRLLPDGSTIDLEVPGPVPAAGSSGGIGGGVEGGGDVYPTVTFQVNRRAQSGHIHQAGAECVVSGCSQSVNTVIKCGAAVAGYQGKRHQVSVGDPDCQSRIAGGIAEADGVVAGGKSLEDIHGGNDAQVERAAEIAVQLLTRRTVIDLEAIGPRPRSAGEAITVKGREDSHRRVVGRNGYSNLEPGIGQGGEGGGGA